MKSRKDSSQGQSGIVFRRRKLGKGERCAQVEGAAGNWRVNARLSSWSRSEEASTCFLARQADQVIFCAAFGNYVSDFVTENYLVSYNWLGFTGFWPGL